MCACYFIAVRCGSWWYANSIWIRKCFVVLFHGEINRVWSKTEIVKHCSMKTIFNDNNRLRNRLWNLRGTNTAISMYPVPRTRFQRRKSSLILEHTPPYLKTVSERALLVLKQISGRGEGAPRKTCRERTQLFQCSLSDATWNRVWFLPSDQFQRVTSLIVRLPNEYSWSGYVCVKASMLFIVCLSAKKNDIIIDDYKLIKLLIVWVSLAPIVTGH